MPSYSAEFSRMKTLELREKIAGLPDFCAQFFRAYETQSSVRTRIGYAIDLRTFFEYLINNIDDFTPVDCICKLTLNDLERVTLTHIEKFTSHLTLYEARTENATFMRENHASGKERKLSAIRSLFRYLFDKELLTKNVASKVKLPKKADKPIVYLQPDEIVRILDAVTDGDQLTVRQRKYHALTKTRDVAMITLLIGTGIRVSECVGLNLEDFDFKQASMLVTRKGGDRVVLYLSREVQDALLPYYHQRCEPSLVPLAGHEHAFFLSLQRRRMSVLTIENLVKKFAQIAAPLKHITPHKLRSTFGTTLYQQSGDIYLVADALGHSDVNTTRKHYAAMADDRRRRAAEIIKLRDDT